LMTSVALHTSIHLQTSRAWREPLVPVVAHRNICVIPTAV
jgi:hypothetical protein